MALINELFKVVHPDELDVNLPQLRKLPRAAADEMCLQF